MRMNSGIILAGQQPDVVNALSQGHQAGRQARESSLYREHGEGIARGDQEALNALSQFSPQSALDIQSKQQTMAFDRERMEMVRQQAKQQATAHAAAMSEAERKLALERVGGMIQAGAMFYKSGDKAGYESWAAQNGVDTQEYPFEQLPAHLAQVVGFKDAITALEEKQPTGEYNQYAAEERAKGKEPLSRIDFALAKKGEGIVMKTPDGTELRIGGAGGGGQEDFTSPAAMVDSIDGILNDPALDWSTGWQAWRQKIPGTQSRRFASRVKQLEGQAFLQAFESLKGAGQITEIEGQKATEAVGRFDSMQRPEDYRAALEEVREVLSRAEARPEGWIDTPEGQAAQSGITETPTPRREALPPVPEGISVSQWPSLYEKMSPEDKALFQ